MKREEGVREGVNVCSSCISNLCVSLFLHPHIASIKTGSVSNRVLLIRCDKCGYLSVLKITVFDGYYYLMLCSPGPLRCVAASIKIIWYETAGSVHKLRKKKRHRSNGLPVLGAFVLHCNTLPGIERAIKCGIINTHAPINTHFRLENKWIVVIAEYHLCYN